MKRIVWILCMGLLPLFSQAVENCWLPDIRAWGLGMNGVTQSLLYNPSLTALSTGKQLSLSCFNRFQMKELSTLGLFFCFPNRWLSTSVDIFSFGYDAYRESRLRLSVGKQLGEQWALGVAVHYTLLQTELQAGDAGRLATDLGISFLPVENLLIGLLIKDLPAISIRQSSFGNKAVADYLIQTGCQWQIINGLLLIASMGTSERKRLLFQAGIEYAAFECFHLRAGLQTAPWMPSLGAGYTFSRFTVDVALGYHTLLGACTGLGLSYRF